MGRAAGRAGDGGLGTDAVVGGLVTIVTSRPGSP
jgi:hypothetical protein